MKPFFLGLCTVLLYVGRTAAAGDCCQHCGCRDNCCKVCRVICETKKVPKPIYDCECEDFCVPGPSSCEVCYDECGCKQRVFTPGCGTVRTRVKLVKKENFEEKKVYKRVVEDLCCQCAEQAKATALRDDAGTGILPTGATLPIAPVPHVQVSGAQPREDAAAEGARFDVLRLLHLRKQ
jgi:hypothetical protein